MLIDSHVHVGDWKYFDGLNRLYSDFHEIVSQLGKKGFSGAAFIPSELKANEELLEEILSFKETGSSFKCWFFPWLNSRKKEHLQFAEENIIHISGFKFHPALDRFKFTQEEHRFLLNLARKNAIPILVHCGAWLEMAHYRFVLDVAEQYPEISFILAHQGGSTYELKIHSVEEVKRRELNNIFFDIAGTHEYWIIEKGVEEIGAEKFLLGSDFPIRDASIYLTLLDGTRLSAEQRILIQGKNFLKLMNSDG